MHLVDSQSIQLLDLPDELLLIILGKLHPIDVLYSLFGVHKRLDGIIITIVRTTHLLLIAQSATGRIISMDDMILDRFCSLILPRIHEDIKFLVLEPSSLEPILLASNYSNLSMVSIHNFRPESMIGHFTDGSPVARIFKEQIKYISLTISSDNAKRPSSNELFTDIYAHILNLCTNLLCFNINHWNRNANARLSLCNQPSTTCFSSSLVILSVNVSTFDDCLYLLDGRLNQLTQLIVNVRYIKTSSFNIDNTQVLPNLTSFSLTSDLQTPVYDDRVLPLLRRMPNLNHLTLYLAVKNRFEFIDGTHFNNELFIHLLHLKTFIFHIRTLIKRSESDHLRSVDDIQKTFTNSKVGQVKCFVDYFNYLLGQCHIYSQPFKLPSLISVTNSFRGERYTSVTELTIYDTMPFEHDFFDWISQGFPSLTHLAVANSIPQKHKRSSPTNDCESTSSSIYFSRLFSLNIFHSHIDYAEQLLHNTNTHLPKLTELQINYENLVTVTDNFMNETTRANCARLRVLRLREDIAFPKHFYSYFPSLNS